MPGHRCTTCRSAPSEQARIASRPSQCCAEKDIYMQAIVLSEMYCCRVPEQSPASQDIYMQSHSAQRDVLLQSPRTISSILNLNMAICSKP